MKSTQILEGRRSDFMSACHRVNILSYKSQFFTTAQKIVILKSQNQPPTMVKVLSKKGPRYLAKSTLLEKKLRYMYIILANIYDFNFKQSLEKYIDALFNYDLESD